MSFNRAIYDPCAYNKRLDESTSVLTYNLDPNKFYNCNQCRINFGIVSGNDVSLTTSNLVDLESELRNQTRLYSLCPEKKFLPGCASCESNVGLPNGSVCCKKEAKFDLPECNMIQYKPRINNVGYELNYPSCGRVPSFTCPLKTCGIPQQQPMRSTNPIFSHKPTQQLYEQWGRKMGLPAATI